MLDGIKQQLQKSLSSERYEHSLRVAATAKELAARFGVDQSKAYLAGLLHDCARELSPEELQVLAVAYGRPVGEHEKRTPALLHMSAGAELAKRRYGVTDPDILAAIESHTLGGSELSPLQKIIYIADFIEPGRDDIDVRQVHDAVDKGLDAAVYEKAKFMLEYSLKIGEDIHPTVQRTLSFFERYRM